MEYKKNLLAASILSAFASVPVFAQESGQSAEETEVIEVRGIRSSIINALNVKRADIKIVDGISADDIGKLPNDNIAEAIQRIPGVQITRSQGRGGQIAVRGLDPRLARTTVNGQTFAAAGFDGFNFGFVESEVASSINVYKSPTADLDEGGLAGVVNIETASALDFDERRAIISVDGIYGDLDKEVDPRLSATFADKFLDDKLGVLFNVVSEDVNTRFDAIWIQSPRLVDTNGDGEDNAVRLSKTRSRIERYEADGLTFNLALDYKVNDQLTLGLKGIKAENVGVNSIANLRPDFNTGDNIVDSKIEPASVDGAKDTIFATEADNVQLWNLPVYRTDDMKTYAYTADIEWTDGTWTVSSALHTSKGESFQNNQFFIFNFNVDHLAADMTSSGAGDTNDLSFVSSQAVNDPNTWSANARPDAVNSISLGANQPKGTELEENAFQIDVDRMFDNGILSSVEFGVKYRNEKSERTRTRVTHDAALVAQVMPDFTEVSQNAATNFLGGNRPNGWPAHWLTVDLPRLLDMVLTPEVRATRQETEFRGDIFSAERDIYAAYAMANFEGEIGEMPFRANLGVRHIRTEQTSNAPVVQGDQDVNFDSDYNNTLPSFSFSLDINDDWVTRFSASQVLIRPKLAASNFNRTVRQVEDPSAGTTDYTIVEGNPNLEPQLADAFDATLEYYYGDGNAVYTSIFYKDVTDAVGTRSVCPSTFDLATGALSEASGVCKDSAGNTFDISQTYNSPEGNTYKGIEFGVTHNFENGFGVVFNTTYLEADSGEQDPITGEDLPPINLSKNTYNFIGYYETDDFAIRAAYNYRSSFLASLGGFLGVQQRDSRGQLDISSSYNVNDNLTLSLRALNVTGEPDVDYSGVPERFQQLGYGGRTYYFGARYEF
ncbi:TonB-dependent receptor [Thalassotalea montiporae]